MSTTFISIHDLTPEAFILYASSSVIEILGYTPDELINRSAWEFFPEEELPFAKIFHQQRIVMDKAAVLAYFRIQNKAGRWVGCECCFTIVYDIMVVCTSIYHRDGKSDGRALAAPVVRRMFSSSPKDPRYHMLSHISVKFTQQSTSQLHEPRAALFLNRFTRTLSIMYATDGIEEVIGIPANIMCGRSFYHCIAENCLPDAVKCLESAKGNDSIAYLRFWFRDPRADDPAPEPESDSDESITTGMSDGMEEGDLKLRSHGEMLHSNGLEFADFATSMNSDSHGVSNDLRSQTSSGDSGNDEDTHEAIFGEARGARSSASSTVPSPGSRSSTPSLPANISVELEAVVSCTSDGLVVCLRKARSMVPHSANYPVKPIDDKGLFTAPWAQEPMLSPLYSQQVAGFATGFAPSQVLMADQHNSASPLNNTALGPDPNEFMGAIRDQAIFAWALTGINGALGSVAKGKPHEPSTPRDGYAVWTNDA